MTVRIINGDAIEELRKLPAGIAHMCCTSPPYWGLRDYGVTGQLGLEPTLVEYVEKMVAVFREVRRVLRDDGTLWLNLGDTYATGAGAVGNCPGGGAQGAKWAGHDIRDRDATRRPHGRPELNGRDEPQAQSGYRGGRTGHEGKHGYAEGGAGVGPMTQPNRMPQEGLKPKDLCGMPWRVAFALQADGWYLRQDIIWAKPNPMPESVRDRCTKSHEYLFLLAKSEKYYCDMEAIAEPSGDDLRRPFAPGQVDARGNGHDRGGGELRRSGNKERKHASERGCPQDNPLNRGNQAGSVPWEGNTRNKRSVWTVATQPFKEAHFATFPPALIEPCILAGCPVGGTVLDPFGGAGTSGLVADRFQRNAILIELNPEYAAMAEKRIHADGPLFSSVTA